MTTAADPPSVSTSRVDGLVEDTDGTVAALRPLALTCAAARVRPRPRVDPRAGAHTRGARDARVAVRGCPSRPALVSDSAWRPPDPGGGELERAQGGDGGAI